MEPATALEGRWYGPLVKPVLPTVASALEQVEPLGDPWAVPRTGLGGAVVIHVARGFGTRRWTRAGRVGVVALEAYNQLVHRPVADPTDRARWLERDLEWVRGVWQSVLEKDSLLVTRVIGRVMTGRVGDARVPEAVVFLRAAVAAGVIAGAVPDRVHAGLDRHATWLGLVWEATHGELDSDGWRGALEAVGLTHAWPSEPSSVARASARESLAALPATGPRDLFVEILSAAGSEPAGRRSARAWEPTLAPSTHGPEPGLRTPGALGTAMQRWGEPIEDMLSRVVHSESQVLARGASYLRAQGGKRVRPLLVVTAAGACGGDPRRALPAAACVEWLHQGSLVLDDIIDDASLRRGAAPLHTATSVPLAVGVAAFVFGRIHGTVQGMHPDIRKRLVDAASTLVDGEKLELHHTADPQLGVTGYFQIIEAKTARLFACAAAVGGLCAEAPTRCVRALTTYGREAGLAFQIADDLLDYLGDEALLGKSPGTDLRARKMTLPLLLLLARAPALRTAVEASMGDAGRVGWVRAQLVEHGVDREVRARAIEHLDRALRALGVLPASAEREQLAQLARLFVERES